MELKSAAQIQITNHCRLFGYHIRLSPWSAFRSGLFYLRRLHNPEFDR